MLQDLWIGTVNVIQPLNLLGVTAGVFLGIIFGVIPGLNAATAVALIIPFAFSMKPEFAFLMMIGAYCGAMFGGAIPAILFRVPGTPTSIMSILDGHELAKKGRGGEAIAMANIAGVIGGLFSTLVLVLAAPALAKVALTFGPPEYFALAVFGISAITSLGTGNQLRSLISCVLGLLFVTIGIDPVTGVERFTFGMKELVTGIDFIPAIIGLFGVSEVLLQAEKYVPSILRTGEKISMKMPRFLELWRMKFTLLLGSLIGTFIGILPGEGGTVASVLAYNEARRWSKTPERFGTGIMEGVVAPECADNASTGGAWCLR
jgi:putative tricarboxylic transport membrane protein